MSCCSRPSRGTNPSYGYANGVHSGRKIERATYDSVAFRYVAANAHPDHDTLVFLANEV